MNKKLLILFVALMVILPVVSGCALRTPNGAPIAPMVPHAVGDVRFNNCVPCHAAELLTTEGMSVEHVYREDTNKDCMQGGCHAMAE